MSAVVELTSDNWDEVVLKSSLPVLVDVWASWCGPCKKLAPLVEQVADALDGQAVVGMVNADDERPLVASLQVLSLPTLFVYKDGKQVAELHGARSAQELIDALQTA